MNFYCKILDWTWSGNNLSPLISSTHGCWLVANNQERIQGKCVGSTSENNALNKSNFSMISNLFRNNNFYALSKHKSKRANMMRHYLVKDLVLGAKNLNKTCLINCSKCAMRARLGVASHLSTTPRWGNPAKCRSKRHNR